jgi:hypothetical protein
MSYFSTLLDDSLGSPEMNVDGSVTPVPYTLTIPNGLGVSLHGIKLTLASFGNIKELDDFLDLPGLTVGVTIVIDSVSPSRNPSIQPKSIKNNKDLMTLSQDYVYKDDGLSSLNVFRFKHDFEPASIRLNQSAGDSLTLTISDNLIDLSLFRALVWGTIN